MTSMSATVPMAVASVASTRPVSWARVARSEWIKLTTIRSTFILLGMTGVLIVGVWALGSTGFRQDPSAGDFADGSGLVLNPYSVGLTISIGLAQLAAGVLGVVLVTNEYASGMIRATFAAVPARTPVLLAKAAVLGLAVLAVAIPALFAAFFVSGAILPAGLVQRIGDPAMLRALVGGGLYLAGIAVIGASLGWMLRSAAGAIATFVGLVILLPMLLPLIPLDAVQTVGDYLPSVVGQEVFRLPGLFDDLTRSGIAPWTGFAIFLGYVLAGLAAAAVVLRRRDA